MAPIYAREVDREQALQDLADECTREGGSAWLMAVQPRSADEGEAYRQLFDRTRLRELRKVWKDANRGLSSLTAPELARLQRKLQREYDAIRASTSSPAKLVWRPKLRGPNS